MWLHLEWLMPKPSPHPSTLQEPGTRPPYLSSVHLATGRDAAWLQRKLRELSKSWGTRIFETADGRLTIPLQDERGGGGGGADDA